MKRKIFTILLGLGLMAVMVACTNKGKAEIEDVEYVRVDVDYEVGEDGSLFNDKILIKKYKGLEVEVPVFKVTDDDVAKSIRSTLQALGMTQEVTDRPVKEGDKVTLDYEGKLEGVPFERGAAKGETITVGAGGYVDGFEEGIIGHKVGETFDVPVTFPQNYSANLAGKDVVFTMTIHKIEATPELTEEILKELKTSAKTIEEYKEQVRKDLEKSNQETIESGVENLVWQALMEQCEVKEYPADEVKKFVDYVDEQLTEAAKEQNMTAAEFFELYYQVTPEDYIKDSIKFRYAVEIIAASEGFKLTTEEYEEGLAKLAKENQYDDVKEYEKEAGSNAVLLQLVQPKVAELLKEQCKRVEPKLEK